MIKKVFILHPFLFFIFPLLFLYVHNIGIFPPGIMIFPLIAGILIIFFLQILLSFIIKDKEKKGILISLLVLMFFTYGIVHEFIKDLTEIGYYKYLLLIYVVIFFISAFFLIRTKRSISVLSKILNITSITLIIINFVQIIAFELNKENLIPSGREQSLSNSAVRPDIYYIILDGYANTDILKEYYKYDNSEFINFLVKKGFYITTQSRSNYPETLLSLASSLNMEYLAGTNKPNDGMLYRPIQNNKVMKLLNEAGYKTINISSNDYIPNIETADLNISSGSFITNEFYIFLFRISMLKVLRKYIDFENLYREKILRTFSKLSNLKRETVNPDQPLFVFAHIFPPHPPYLFGPNAEPVNRGFNGDLNLTWWGRSTEYMKLYEDQLTFVNEMMKISLDSIISNARENTIVIIQSDHGPRQFIGSDKYNTRMRIFNAFLLPKGDKNIFYNSITPVNTFRLIFNHYFNTRYNLLKDKSYYPEKKFPHKFFDVTKETSNIVVK